MQTYRQTRDILHWLVGRHTHLADIYRTSRARDGQRRAGWLLDRMWGQQEALGEIIRAFETSAPAEVLDTYFQYIPEEDDAAVYLDNLTARQDLTDQAATELVMTSSRQFEQLYRKLADMADFDTVRETFASMAQKIRRQQEKAAQGLGPFQDV